MFLYTSGFAELLRARLWAAEGEDRESGASALEWAIIAAISVVMAVAIGTVIYKVVDKKSTDINNCANVAVGTQCAGGTGGTGTGTGGGTK